MRTSIKEVKSLIKILNKSTNNPVESWIRANGTSKSQIGCYHLDESYGGYSLYQMSNTSGGCRDISTRGTKKELATFIRAMLRGIEAINANSKA